MRPFVTPHEMSQIDLATTRHLQISSFELMKRVAYLMSQKIETYPGKILVLAGPGNNGGDGYCVAEFLRQAGRDVMILPLMPPGSSDAKEADRFCRAVRLTDDRAFRPDIVVDAVFGSQSRSELSSELSRHFKKWNQRAAVRVSLDIPSGTDGLNGSAHEHAFLADETLVVGFPKQGMVEPPCAETLGKVSVIDPGFVSPRDASLWMIEKRDFHFRKRPRAGHKGLYGRCGVIGGMKGLRGAAIMAAEAAHRVGSGYVSIFPAKDARLEFRIKDASFLWKTSWTMTDFKNFDALVMGCGGFTSKVNFSRLRQPLVVDADALPYFKKSAAPAVLTPHPGEAAKLLKSNTKAVQKERLASLGELVDRTKASVYLKGAPGLLRFWGDNKSYVNLSINPVMSKAGSGDVLAGIMGGFLAQSARLEGDDVFKLSLFSSLAFQNELGEVLRDLRASLASDQLFAFSETFRRLSHETN